jgi:hypothetical protein
MPRCAFCGGPDKGQKALPPPASANAVYLARFVHRRFKERVELLLAERYRQGSGAGGRLSVGHCSTIRRAARNRHKASTRPNRSRHRIDAARNVKLLPDPNSNQIIVEVRDRWCSA